MVDLMTAPDDLQDNLLNSYEIEYVPLFADLFSEGGTFM